MRVYHVFKQYILGIYIYTYSIHVYVYVCINICVFIYIYTYISYVCAIYLLVFKDMPNFKP